MPLLTTKAEKLADVFSLQSCGCHWRIWTHGYWLGACAELGPDVALTYFSREETCIKIATELAEL